MMAVVLVMSTLSLNAQQLPDPHFEDWSGAKFDGNIQPQYWHGSNVEQVGFKFNFTTRETGRSGYCVKVANTYCGAMGIGQVSPGYVTVGNPWQYINGMDKANATGGTDGGISFAYRPDSMYVWIKRTGSSATSENFSLLFYSWKGNSTGSSYKANENNNCTSTGNHTNEESDIRQALDANKCGTITKATQVAEGFLFDMKEYSNWTQVKVPIYYFNDEVPEKANVILSSSGYPNFRASGNINEGNAIYADDIELIYSAKIQQLYIGGKQWKGFDPNSSAEQVYSVGRTTVMPEIYAMRGAGSIKNIAGTTVNFPGRRLSDSEVTIQPGQIDGAPTVITVTSGDGQSTMTYRIKLVQAPSTNAKLSDILVNGESISGFNPIVGTYAVELPYGTTAAPVVTPVKAEDGQTVTVTQATSPTGSATIQVTAPDGTTTKTYTLNFSVALLSDNTLAGIKVNGTPIADFVPSQTTYRVELPLGTTTMPTVEAISAYPAGAQTINYIAPATIDNGQYKIEVSTPGNPTPKVYKLNLKITASTNNKLADLKMGDYITNFSPTTSTYRVTLPMGTTQQPEITYTKGDPSQTVTIEYGGVDGTSKVTVVAASGDVFVYNIICSTEKSTASHLNAIFIGGEPLEGFDPNITQYTYNLPMGTTELPAITWTAADDFETITLTPGGLNGTTRITVTAGNGNTTIYKITFTLETSSNATLDNIFIGGEPLEGFDPNIFIYTIVLPKGTTELPVITWTQHDEWQTVTPRYGGVNGDTKLTVRPQTGASQTYILQFRVQMDTVNHLEMIYLGGEPLQGFHKDTLQYIDSLPVGVSTIPAITYTKAAESESVKVLNAGNVRTVRVTAENGSVREYVITFVITKLESAFPKMIYVGGDSLPGFEKNELSYIYEFDGDELPAVSVEKDGNQQVTILMPVGEGTAKIIVRPEGGGEGNTYTILFRRKTSEDVMLTSILLDGVALPEFEGARLDYTIPYTDHIPEVTFVAADGQKVTKLTEKNVVRLYVAAGGQSATYILTFDKQYSSVATLKQIMLNGSPMSQFKDTTYAYAINLPAGSTVPELSYEKNHDAQVVYMGQSGEKAFTITVIAEDGTMAVYTLDFTVAQFTSTQLLSIELDGTPLALTDGVYTYEQTLLEGASLPELTYTKDAGQTVLAVNTSAAQQQIIVKAENGDVATYTVNYTIIRSNDATLSDIKLDGVSLEGFAPATHDYTHQLPWHTTVVPVIQPVSAAPGQTVTIEYGAINTTTHIHVVAADGAATQDYTIAFPVYKSNNTKLESVEFADVEFDFNPENNDYVIALPYQTKAVPAIAYFAAESEQNIEHVNAPITDTTKLIVTAENGDKRTYTFAFTVPLSDKTNVLRQLVIYETGTTRDIVGDESDITIDLPYGTTEFNLGYVKNYDEQTVLVQPGGIFHPTILTVKANRDGEADKVYTITPNIDSQNPAVLTSIKIDGVEVPNFDKNRFTYVVNRYDVGQIPQVTVTKDDAVTCQPEQDLWHWKAVVSANGITNEYAIYWHYPNEAIPNEHFTTWVKNDKNTADKPKGWRATNDYITGYNSPDAVTKLNNTRVQLYNKFHSTLDWAWSNYGCAPAIMNLTGMAVNHTVSGGSRTRISGGNVSFHNTPDKAEVNFAYPDVDDDGKGAIIRFYFVDANGAGYKYDITQSSEKSSFSTVTRDLPISGKRITGYDIIFDPASAIDNDGKGACGAILQVDYVHFVYSSALSKVLINEDEAIKDGTKFTYTLPSSEEVAIPQLTFVGEVSDQAQLVSWSNEKKGKRTAYVKNFAEDSTFTTYTVEVIRPLSQVNTLASLEVNGVPVTGWNADKTDYTVTLPFGQKRIYDVQALHGSNYQTVTTSQSGNVVTVTVVPESGETKTYTVTFVEQKSNDVTLASLTATGVDYDPAVKTYNLPVATLPDIRFTKQSDGQTVIQRNGVLYITAEDGVTKDTITITNTPPLVATSGKLTDLSLEGTTIDGWGAEVYRYSQPEPAYTSFIREFATDAVKQTITPDSITWKVTGTSAHTYALVYPTDKSADIALDTIFINGQPLEDFNAAETEYTIYNNNPINIEVRPKQGQQLSVSIQVSPVAPSGAHGRNYAATPRKGLLYTINVTAEDGLAQQTYTVTVLPEISSDASLQMIRLDGVDLPGFRADSTKYTVVLPATNPKLVEPTMPSITYVTNHFAQAVTVDTAHVGGTSYINVVSDDGTTNRTYELLITTEPSHNADLNGLMLDGEVLPNFSSDRHFYSASVEDMHVQIAYSSVDRFQHVDTLINGNTVTVRVMAQDSVTVNNYVIELYTKTLSADVTLADILLNGQSFTAYDATLAPFSPMNSFYTIPVASNSQTPDVSATLNSAGQTMDITENGDSVFITVTAEDGVHTNTYTLYFKHEYSTNTALAKVEVGDSLFAIVPGKNTFVLPIGVKTHPMVYYELADYGLQSVENESDSKTLWSIDVVAESGARATYSIEFVYTLSPNALLSDITANDVTISGFRADSSYYAFVLPAGVRTMPEVKFEKGDQWQYEPTIETITADYRTTWLCTVLAEDSIHSKTYTVVYEIQKSDVDTLGSITLSTKMQEEFVFDAHVTSYVLTLPKGVTTLPAIECEPGDQYQDTVSSWVNNVYTMTVIAENGQQRTYTITFNQARNDDATLFKIYCAGEELEGFDPETENYTVKLPYGTTSIPVVTYLKNNTKQQDVMTVLDNIVVILVTAEDGTVRSYTLTFVFGKSPEARLAMINVGGEPLADFDPETKEYTVTLPYGTTELPEVTAVLADSTATKEITSGGLSVVISTTSADEEHFEDYTVNFVIERCDVDWLLDLKVSGTTLAGFDKDTLSYTITYPQGSDSTVFVHAEDISWTVADSTEKVDVIESGSEIQVLVTAENGTVRPYEIRQVIMLSSNSLLSDLTLNGKTIKDFDPETYTYTYIVLEGGVLPDVDAVAADKLAEISITPGTEDVKIYCTAQDGSESMYTVVFEKSSLNTSETPASTDVLLKQIAGSETFAAYSIRVNTWLAIYDDKGQMYLNVEVPACNPNDASISYDARGKEILTDANGDAAYFTLPAHGQTLFYIFYSGKERIKSGKFMMQ